MKRGNYADCLYAANYAQKQGAREALFVDDAGNLLEGSTSNLFALIGKKLVTPPLGKTILAGVMRQQIINAATELGIAVDERPLPLTELASAREVFLCNSLLDILPVSEIDRQPIQRGQIWQELLKTLKIRIET
jgi:branched-subunit amino acid aminotransferase/4-amino-4-deoxychorismate lyase